MHKGIIQLIIYFFYISLFIRKLAICFSSKEIIVASIRDSIITQYSVMPIPYIYNDTNYSMHISLVIKNLSNKNQAE